MSANKIGVPMNPLSPLFWYRISHLLWRFRVPLLPRLITLAMRFGFAAYIPHSATIGKGVVLGYNGLCIVIHGRTVIGDGSHIDQQVTIGGTSKKYEVPVLGKNVYVGAGAKILGPITIGDDVVIGANAVVVTSIPSNSLAVGVPARVIKSGIHMSDYV